ncbi:aromatic compound degradation protein PaaI [Cystobacter fuscus]|uniref:Aromatic compound degradation protein PaaI n=1 Tax=Cystobacter fuscus TaxID=43 RepID=A0A250J808_9BACT|nr:PaaI family thioesterase [Cystobacter fuscus]ATB39670.1 aromatic compound degradation protein PaaI [Cystobacter fuscus]
MTLLPAGDGFSTMDLHTTFVRAIGQEQGKLTCEAEIIHMGGRMATAQGRQRDDAGRRYAHGVTTCMIFRWPRSGEQEG